MNHLKALFDRAACPFPDKLLDWKDTLYKWYDEYEAIWTDASIHEIDLPPASFSFDLTHERVCVAFAVSIPQLMKRDVARMRGFPNVNLSVQRALGEVAFPADRGHFLGHVSGGELDINLFPHRRDLNRGWSVEGRKFREMERFVAANPGTFFYHRAIYCDDTWIPEKLEYGILRADDSWWVETFNNRLV